jgi:hypothetical protein
MARLGRGFQQPVYNDRQRFAVPAGPTLVSASDSAVGSDASALPYALNNTAEGGTDGTTITVGNSGGASGDAFDSVINSPKFSNAHPVTGNMGIDLYSALGVSNKIGWTRTFGQTIYGRYYVYTDVLVSASSTYIEVLDAAVAYCGIVEGPDPTGKVNLYNAALSTVATSTMNLSINTLYRIEYKLFSHASAGTVEARIYLGHSLTPLETVTATGLNTRGTAIGQSRLTHDASGGTVSHSWVDDLNANAIDFPGPSATSIIVSDSATGADTVTQRFIAVTDAATGSDTSSLSTANLITASDSGTATDVVSAYARTVVDVATAVEGFPLGPLYGTPFNTDGAANMLIDAGMAGIRFRAQHSGTFSGIKNWWIFSTPADGTGPYGGGTGGHVVVELRTDDGTASHFPTSTVLSTFDIPDPMNRDGNQVLNPPVYAYSPGLGGRLTWNFWEISMPTVALTAGTLYHLVYRNIDAAPNTNFVSLDFLYNAAGTPNMQPGISDTDLAGLRYSGGWSVEYGVTPVHEVHYADGFKQGFGYQNSTFSDPKPIWGANKVRTLFTPASTCIAQTVKVRLRRVGTPGNLQVSLLNIGGTVLDSGSIAGVPTTDTWVTYTFTTPQTLTVGQQYRLELTATGDASNRYQIYGFLDGGWAHFTTQPFPEGRAQEDTGGGWVDTYTGFSGGDWQLYFEVSAPAPTLTAALPVTDTGSAVESIPTLAKATTDSATGTDVAALQAGNLLTANDSATASDTLTGRALALSDSATAADTAAVDTGLVDGFEDESFQTDAFQSRPSLPGLCDITSTLGALTQSVTATTNIGVSATEAGTSTDVVSGRGIAVPDSAIAADVAPTLAKPGTDSATSTDVVADRVIAVTDAAVGADTSALAVAPTVTDSGTATESIPTLAKATTDVATVADVAALAVPIAASDVGTAADAAAFLTPVLATVTDSATAVDAAVMTNVPQNLIAVAVSTNEIDLTWDVFAGAVAYDIERDGAIIAFDVLTNAYDDVGLAPNTHYVYRVRAVV